MIAYLVFLYYFCIVKLKQIYGKKLLLISDMKWNTVTNKVDITIETLSFGVGFNI